MPSAGSPRYDTGMHLYARHRCRVSTCTCVAVAIILLTGCSNLRHANVPGEAELSERDQLIAHYRERALAVPNASERWRELGGVLMEHDQDLPGAEKAFAQAYDSAKRRGDTAEMARNMTGLGQVAVQRQAADKALRHFDKALELHRRLGDRESMAWDYVDLARVHLDTGQLELAHRTIRGALENGVSFEITQLSREMLATLGVAYELHGDPGWGRVLVRESEAIAQTREQPMNDYRSYTALGLSSLERWNLRAAELLFRKALLLSYALEAPAQTAEAYRYLGLVYERSGEPASARLMYREALRGYETSGHHQGEREVRQALARTRNEPAQSP